MVGQQVIWNFIGSVFGELSMGKEPTQSKELGKLSFDLEGSEDTECLADSYFWLLEGLVGQYTMKAWFWEGKKMRRVFFSGSGQWMAILFSFILI